MNSDTVRGPAALMRVLIMSSVDNRSPLDTLGVVYRHLTWECFPSNPFLVNEDKQHVLLWLGNVAIPKLGPLWEWNITDKMLQTVFIFFIMIPCWSCPFPMIPEIIEKYEIKLNCNKKWKIKKIWKHIYWGTNQIMMHTNLFQDPFWYKRPFLHIWKVIKMDLKVGCNINALMMWWESSLGAISITSCLNQLLVWKYKLQISFYMSITYLSISSIILSFLIRLAVVGKM